MAGTNDQKRKRKRNSETGPAEEPASRLKRKRTSVEHKPPVEAPPEPPVFAVEELEALRAAIRDKRHGDVVRLARDSLERKADAPLRLVRLIPELPGALLAVGRSGHTDPDFVRCLLAMSMKVGQAGEEASKSISNKNMGMDMESIRKKSEQWAVQVLTNLLADPLVRTAHADVYVDSAANVHDVVVDNYPNILAAFLEHLATSTPNRRAELVTRLLDILLPLLRDGSPLAAPLHSSVLEAVARLPVPMQLFFVRGDTHAQPQQQHYYIRDDQLKALVDALTGSTGNGVRLHDLSIDAQVELLRSSRSLYDAYITRLQKAVTWDMPIDTIATLNDVRVLSAGCVRHLHLYFRLLDDISTTASSSSSTVSLRSPWVRAVFAAIATHPKCSIVHRLPPTIRPAAGQLLILHRALRQARNLDAGVLGARMLAADRALASFPLLERPVLEFAWACGRLRISKLLPTCVALGRQRERQKERERIKEDPNEKVLAQVWTRTPAVLPTICFPVTAAFGVALFAAVNAERARRYHAHVLKKVPTQCKQTVTHDMNLALHVSEELRQLFDNNPVEDVV